MDGKSTFGVLAPELHALGYPVIPVAGKRPTIEGWQSLKITTEQVKYWAGNGQAHHNIGLRTGDDSVGGVALSMADIDVYDKVVARAISASLVLTFGATIERRGQAPKRGLIYAQAVKFSKFTSPDWVSPDGVVHRVEWLGAGQQFVAFGIHPDTKQPYTYDGASLADVEPWTLPVVTETAVADWIDNVLPTLIPATWTIKGAARKGLALAQPADAGERALLNYKAKLHISPDALRDALAMLDPDCDYGTWLQVGMALHHQTGGGAEGYTMWADWSRTSAKFDESTTRYKWDHLQSSPERGPIVTAATILKMAADARGAAAPSKAVNYRERMVAATDEKQLRAVMAEVKFDGLLVGMELDVVASFAVQRMKEVGGGTVRASVMRDELAPARREAKGLLGDGGMEPWCADYVWVQFEDAFVAVDNQESVSLTSFNAAHGRDVKGRWMTHDGHQISASAVAWNELQIPIAARRMYLPWADQFFEIDGLNYLNRYRPGSVPDATMEADWTPLNRQAVDRVRQHIVDLCTTEATHFINWCGYNVQNPGRKIRHSVLIKGTEGDGKSLLGALLELVMGPTNVGKVTQKVLNTDFNGWAEGHSLCVIEELRMAGHNRYDVANALKECHTNDRVTIHRKGLDNYTVLNTQNYICFTNFGDAVPINDDDRRYFVIFSPFVDAAELAAAGMGVTYFNELFDLIRDNVSALRGWFLGLDLTGFDPNGRAPGSNAKLAMIAASAHDDDEMIKEIIEEGTVGVSKQVISTSHLTAAMRVLAMDDSEFQVPQTSTLSRVLSRLGYAKKREQLKWEGNVCRVWVRDVRLISNSDAIRVMLDSTKIEIPF